MEAGIKWSHQPGEAVPRVMADCSLRKLMIGMLDTQYSVVLGSVPMTAIENQISATKKWALQITGVGLGLRCKEQLVYLTWAHIDWEEVGEQEFDRVGVFRCHANRCAKFVMYFVNRRVKPWVVLGTSAWPIAELKDTHQEPMAIIEQHFLNYYTKSYLKERYWPRKL
jgi:hypothetical protein